MGSIGPDPATSSKHVIPTIDMSAWLDENGSSPAALDAVVKEVSDACRAFGFFQLVGHGIPFEMQSEVFACAQRFFEMPLNEKMGVSIKKAMGLANRGYEAFQGQSLQVGGLPDLKEVRKITFSNQRHHFCHRPPLAIGLDIGGHAIFHSNNFDRDTS